MDNYLIHYRTPGSKNGVRLYQYKDGRLTPAGKRRYLKGGIKGTNVGPEYEQELEFNSQQNVYPSNNPKPKSKPQRSRPNSKVDQIDKKIQNAPLITFDNHEPSLSTGYRRVEGERPFRIRSPYFRDDVIRDEKNIFKKIGRLTRKLEEKTKNLIGTYFEKSFGKHFAYQVVPPKGSDGINHLIPYTNKEAAEALNSYMISKSNGKMGNYINTFVQTAQMNIANGCARFLDSIGLDDEVNKFLKKLGIKDNNDMIK